MKKQSHTIHAARLSHSPRLQRLLRFLGRFPKRGTTTREIMYGADICAVSTAVDELKDPKNGGIKIDCRPDKKRGKDGSRIYRYRLIAMPKPS